MNNVQEKFGNVVSTKAKAVKDAQQMQASITDAARRIGKDPPKYALIELIGKGSYGRVYKGKDMATADLVAVKIIDLDESDTGNPRNADSYSEFLKEIGALKLLSETKARNINHVIDALLVGQSMWMITEYCAGGSVATLMKPTAPGGLQEKWIIPILREVAEAIKWVHDAGIIHRDIKCANILVTELGEVQLCDFGVAGTLDTKLDKRSTFIGTLHWMAPELFDSDPSYGKEVDIWAFGCMIFEIATGLPPNVGIGVPLGRTGGHSNFHVPKLEGDNYSNDLRGIVAYCLEELPSLRPSIQEVQKHSYISGTKSRYPSSTLVHLVRAFKMWENHVGSRESLFMPGGAQGQADASTPIVDDEWNFSNTVAFDREISNQSTVQDVYDAYGNTSELQHLFSDETTQPRCEKPSRRRPPPYALARLQAPLEKIFDPNTLSNYEDNSRSHYGRPSQHLSSDLPLRNDNLQSLVKDTMIDLDAYDEMVTVRANGRASKEGTEDGRNLTLHDFSRFAFGDPADININRRTQDWKFPAMSTPASAEPESSRLPAASHPPGSLLSIGSGGHPAQTCYPTEPMLTMFGGSALDPQQASLAQSSLRESLIDLDMSFPNAVPSFSARPSTASSNTSLTSSDEIEPGNSFEWERHTSFSFYGRSSSESTPETESLPTEQSAVPHCPPDNSATRDDVKIHKFSGSDAGISISADLTDSDTQALPLAMQATFASNAADPSYTIAHLPELPSPPSKKVLSGLATNDEVKKELNGTLSSMNLQLDTFRNLYAVR